MLPVGFLKINISGVEKALGLYFLFFFYVLKKCVYVCVCMHVKEKEKEREREREREIEIYRNHLLYLSLDLVFLFCKMPGLKEITERSSNLHENHLGVHMQIPWQTHRNSASWRVG